MSNYVLAYQMRPQIISNFWNISTDTRSVHLKLTKIKYWNKAVEKGGRGGGATPPTISWIKKFFSL